MKLMFCKEELWDQSFGFLGPLALQPAAENPGGSVKVNGQGTARAVVTYSI